MLTIAQDWHSSYADFLISVFLKDLVAQIVQNLPNVETRVRSLGLEDPPEKGELNLPSILALENSVNRGA